MRICEKCKKVYYQEEKCSCGQRTVVLTHAILDKTRELPQTTTDIWCPLCGEQKRPAWGCGEIVDEFAELNPTNMISDIPANLTKYLGAFLDTENLYDLSRAKFTTYEAFQNLLTETHNSLYIRSYNVDYWVPAFFICDLCYIRMDSLQLLGKASVETVNQIMKRSSKANWVDITGCNILSETGFIIPDHVSLFLLINRWDKSLVNTLDNLRQLRAPRHDKLIIYCQPSKDVQIPPEDLISHKLRLLNALSQIESEVEIKIYDHTLSSRIGNGTTLCINCLEPKRQCVCGKRLLYRLDKNRSFLPDGNNRKTCVYCAKNPRTQNIVSTSFNSFCGPAFSIQIGNDEPRYDLELNELCDACISDLIEIKAIGHTFTGRFPLRDMRSLRVLGLYDCYMNMNVSVFLQDLALYADTMSSLKHFVFTYWNPEYKSGLDDLNSIQVILNKLRAMTAMNLQNFKFEFSADFGDDEMDEKINSILDEFGPVIHKLDKEENDMPGYV